MLFVYFLTPAHTTRSVSKVFQMATSLEVLAVSVVLRLLLCCVVVVLLARTCCPIKTSPVLQPLCVLQYILSS